MPSPRNPRLHALAGAIAALLLAAPAADAQVATPVATQVVTRFTTYMHSGPGLQYSVTDEIPNRTPLAPESCTAGWCRVRYGGGFGWVQQNTLVAGPSTAQPKPGERPVECMDFARTGWPDAGNLERVCIFQPVKPVEIDKPAG